MADQVHAAPVPIDTRVSMVVDPWRRFRSATRWNGHPTHQTTGVVRAATTHSHPPKCSEGTIEISMAGTESTVAATSRRPSSARCCSVVSSASSAATA